MSRRVAERALLRELNTGIRELGGRGIADDHRFHFLCECGCWGELELTLQEFDCAGGAMIDGHDAPPSAAAGMTPSRADL